MAGSSLKAAVVYGGVSIDVQMKGMETTCDLLIATPGRLIDMIGREKVSLSRVIYLCLDEADRYNSARFFNHNSQLY